MKKRMTVFMAISMVAAMTHAGSFDWGGWIASPTDPDEFVGTGTMAWLTWFGSTPTTGTITAFDTNTGLSNLGGTVVDSYTLTELDISNYDFNKNYGNLDSNGGVNGYFMITVWDPTVPTGYLGYYFSSEVKDLGDATGNGSIRITAGWGPGQFINPEQFEGINITLPVPEPTSMALVALGLAAVGLRRRFRK